MVVSIILNKGVASGSCAINVSMERMNSQSRSTNSVFNKLQDAFANWLNVYTLHFSID